MKLEDVRVGMRVRWRSVDGGRFVGPFNGSAMTGTVDTVSSDGWVRVRLDGVDPRYWPYGACTVNMLEPLDKEGHG